MKSNSIRQRRNLISAVLALALLNSCASTPPTKTSGRRSPRDQSKISGNAASSSAAAKSAHVTREDLDLREVHRLFSQAQYETVIKKSTLFQRRYPRSTRLHETYNLQGLSYLLTQKPTESIAAFKMALDLTEKPEQRALVSYNLASAQFDAGMTDDSEHTLSDVNPELLDSNNRRKGHMLRGKIQLKKGQSLEATREFLRAHEIKQDPDSQDEIQKSLRSISNRAHLDVLKLEMVPPGGLPALPGGDFVLYRIAEIDQSEGKFPQSELQYQLLLEKYPDSVLASDVRTILQKRSSANEGNVQRNVVGLLLPMKGKFAAFGESALHAVSLAFKVFGADAKDPGITLAIEDSGEDGESAAQALERLVHDRGAVAVIGPLLSKGIDTVLKKAEELRVPLISLGQKSPLQGEFIFHSGLSARLQSESIAKYAVEKLGLKNFAIVFPSGNFGEEYAQSFWNSVEKLGGKVVAYESYSTDDTDFRQVIDKVSGLYYTGARQRELDDLARLRIQQKIKKKTRRTEQYFSLKPIIDYDAVFIPDEPKNVGQLLPTFAYRDVDKMLFLGSAAWNSDDLVRRLGPLADGTLFTDAFMLQASDPLTRDFVKNFQQTFEEDPGSIEALAFDAAQLLKRILTEETPKSRLDVATRLKTVKNIQGLTGKLSYEDGFFTRPLKILTVKTGQITEVPRTP